MDRFLPGYERQIVVGAGLNTAPGRPKVVLHTTETGPGALQPLINHWRVNWGAGLPHFIIEGSRCVQLLPIDVGAYTLENAPGGADTNRSGPAVQVEIVSRAENDWDDETYETVGRWLADLKKAGHDFDIETTPRWYGANEGIVLASYNSPIRMSAEEYMRFNGWCAHQHCPENAHWDCGKKNTERIKQIARYYLGTIDPGTPTPPGADDVTLEELQKELSNQDARSLAVLTKMVDGKLHEHIGTTLGRDPRNNRVYEFERPGLQKRYVVSTEEFDTLTMFGVPYVGDLPVTLIDSRVTIPELSDEELKNIATFTADEVEQRLKNMVEMTKLSAEDQADLKAAGAGD